MISIIYPCKSRDISVPFGPQVIGNRVSDGVMFKCPVFSQVYAVADGTVVEVENDASYGRYLVLQHQGFCSVYANLYSVEVISKDEVKQGDIIAISGLAGYHFKPGLYLEIRTGSFYEPGFWHSNNGKFKNSVDPVRYLKRSTDWRLDLGDKALANLHEKGLVSEPDRWKKNLLCSIPSWIFWEMINRIVNRLEPG